ncbi:MAG: beta-galactosidase trimerization domain-containing protein [Bryobacteraceae bacterium]
MMTSRRELLEQSVAAALLAPAGAAAPLAANDAGWFDRPMRWAQLNLTEDDPANMDIGFWLDYFKRIHADAACLTAGGVVAFYPTKIPFHHRSQWLDQRESFYTDMVEGCRKLNMVVVARTDPHATYQDVYDAHPDWIAVDAEGHKRRHPDKPDMWITCALGPYNFEFMTEVTREIVSLFPVGGVFSNRWMGSGMCYCEHCQSNFRAAYHMELPRTSDPRDPRRRNYIVWRQQRLFELWKLWDDQIRKTRPGARYIANSGGGALSGLDMKTVGEMSPTLFADRQCRSGVMAPWANGKNGKEYRAALGNKAIGGIFNTGIVAPYRWLNSNKSAAETRLWVLDGIANGLRPWFNKVSGSVHDKRGLKVIEDLYQWHFHAEPYLRNEYPIARVAMVYSQQTAEFYGGAQARAKVEDHTLGMYQALIDARMPFEMVHDGLLDAAHIGRYKLLLLPNIAALSDGQCRQLREYVQRGGSLVATYETSLYNEWGERRSDFGLADLFGASFEARRDGPIQNSYFRVERNPQTGRLHPILKGLEDAEYIIGGTWQVDVKDRGPLSHPPLTRIPPVTNLPMEKTYWTVDRTNVPGVYLKQIGQGRIVYFPWDIDRLYWEILAEDHGKLLRNAVEWAANEPPPVTVAGAGMFDVTMWRQKKSLTVHLVNLTNPMAMRPNLHELIPSPPQEVTVRLPPGAKAARVQLLVAGGTVPAQQSGGSLKLTVQSVLDHEVIAIDLA